MKKQNITDKKPDFETESFRAWLPTDKELKENIATKSDLKIKYKDVEFVLTGFTKCYKHDKLVFAYKFKHESKLILYYIPETEDKTQMEETKTALNLLKNLSEIANYNIQDAMDTFKNMYLELQTLEKLSKIKQEKENKKNKSDDKQENKNNERI